MDKDTKSEDITNQLYQKPNTTILGYRLAIEFI